MRYGRMVTTALLGALLMLTASAPAVIGTPANLVLISQTDGVIWSYDIDTGQVSQFATVTLPNFDIQFLKNKALLIGSGDAIYQLDLRTLEESLVIQDNRLGLAVGLAVSRRAGGTYYIADLPAGLFAYDARSGQLQQLLAIEGIEGIAVDRKGIVYLGRGPLIQRVDPSQDPLQLETMAEIPDTGLNGMVLTNQGELYAVSTPGPSPTITAGVYKVDLTTGEVTAIYEGDPLGQPEDVAVDRNGDLYVIDSAEPRRLFRIPSGGGEIETLHTGEPFADTVDILLSN